MSRDDDESRSSIEKLIDSGNVITDKTSMAELLNTFFTDCPKNLISTQSTHVAQSPSAINQVKNAFAIPSITTKRVSELLLSIPSHKATDDDGISVKILKIGAPAVPTSLTRLLNLCISSKVFSSARKVAKVTPVFKGNGSRSDCNNYTLDVRRHNV